MSDLALLAALSVIALSEVTCHHAAAEDLTNTLFARGVGPIGDAYLPLAKPLLLSADASARQAILEKRTQRIGWERFAKDSVFAPIVIDIEALKDAGGNRLAHDIHSAFIAYAPLADLEDEQLLSQIFGSQSDETDGEAVGREIPADVLREHGIHDEADETHYVFVSLPLMNRIELRGVLQFEKSRGSDWIQVTWQFDPRFHSHAEYRNTWTKLETNEVGRVVRGKSHAYSGCGGFIAVYQLDADRNQLLTETRVILHEPDEWFSGSNFLRSKLPVTLQESARKFRQKIQQP